MDILTEGSNNCIHAYIEEDLMLILLSPFALLSVPPNAGIGCFGEIGGGKFLDVCLCWRLGAGATYRYSRFGWQHACFFSQQYILRIVSIN
jgi:hypothetical protein